MAVMMRMRTKMTTTTMPSSETATVAIAIRSPLPCLTALAPRLLLRLPFSRLLDLPPAPSNVRLQLPTYLPSSLRRCPGGTGQGRVRTRTWKEEGEREGNGQTEGQGHGQSQGERGGQEAEATAVTRRRPSWRPRLCLPGRWVRPRGGYGGGGAGAHRVSVQRGGAHTR